MNNSNLSNNKAFKNVDPKKLKVLEEMFTEMGTKPIEQKMQILLTYGMKMKQMGLQFTSEESKVIMDSMKENLSPQERNKVDMMIKMMNSMNQS